MSGEHVIERFERPGADLALHRWLPAEPRSAVFFVHGVQSHGEWLFETGPELANRDVAVYLLDRRGSGRSSGAPGDIDRFETWIEDYVAALSEVRSRHADVPLTMLGQSMGGSLAAGVACHPNASHDLLLLAAPSLNRHRTRRTEAEIRALREDPRQDALRPVGIEDTAYTHDPQYLAFIRRDPRILRTMTTRMLVALYDLEVHYMSKEAPLASKPCALVLPSVDPIIDREVSRSAFLHLSGGDGIVVELPSTEHYLEFSKSRKLFWSLVAQLARIAGL